MLREILERLRSGGTWTIEGLARELGTSPELVEAAVEDLARRGYLAPVEGGGPGGACDDGARARGCAACPAAGSCVRAAPTAGTAGGDATRRRIWSLTQKT